MLHDQKAVSLSPSKGKAKEDDHWNVGWWEFHSLVEQPRRYFSDICCRRRRSSRPIQANRVVGRVCHLHRPPHQTSYHWSTFPLIHALHIAPAVAKSDTPIRVFAANRHNVLFGK